MEQLIRRGPPAAVDVLGPAAPPADSANDPHALASHEAKETPERLLLARKPADLCQHRGGHRVHREQPVDACIPMASEVETVLTADRGKKRNHRPLIVGITAMVDQTRAGPMVG